MATVRPSNEIIEQIKKFETFQKNRYPDLKTGKMAIGYGDTEGDNSKEITIEEGTTRLHGRLARAGESIGKRLNREIHQDHQDVLLDMEYNGGGGMLDETIDRINSGVDDAEIAQKLALYNKSTDAKTGLKFYVQNLQDRANHRSQLWTRSKGIVANNNTVEEDMLQGFEPEGSIQMQDNTPGSANDMLEGFEPQAPALPVSPKSKLDFVADSIVPESAEDQMRVKEAKRLSVKLNKPYADMLEELYVKPANEIMARNAHALTATHFPAVTKWAQKDDANYVLMRDTEDYTQKVEARTKLINNDSNFEKALKSNATQAKSAAVYMGMFAGKISHSEVKQYLRDIDAEKKSQSMTGDVARTQQMAAAESSKMRNGFKKVLDGAFPDKGDELSTALPRIKDAYDGTIEAADGFFGMMGQYLDNPKAFGLMLTQSAGSSAAPAALALGGAATLNPVGAVAGASASFALGAAFGFAGRMDENLEEFRNPNTGDIDFDRAFSDPKRVAMWEREAATYGVTLGAADTIFTLVGGRFFSMAEKAAAKTASGTAGKVIGKAGAAVASAGAKGAEESGSEFIGTLAADAVGGKLNKDSIAKAAEKSVMEGIAGSFMGPVIGYSASRIEGYIETKKQAVGKLVKTVEKSSEANKNTVKLSEIRATVNSNEVGVQNIDQVKDLIDETLKGEDTPPPFNPEDDLDVEPQIESEMANFNRRKSGMVEISPREWDEHFTNLGLDPLVEMAKLGPEARMAYQAGKESDSSFTIPASEWVTYSPEELDPSADAIARLNGSDYNSVEANETLKGIMKDPFVSLDQFIESDTPPAIPGQEDPASDIGGSEAGIRIVEPTEAEGNIVSRPINLIQKGRTEAGQKVFLDITRSMKAATSDSPDVDLETIDVLAEIYMTRLNHRAEMLGVPVEEIASKLKFGVVAKGQQEKVRGSYFPKRALDGIAKMVFSRHADAPTLVHEFGHAFLQEMAEDYEAISSIPKEDMTVAQREYRRSMDTAAKHLKIDNMGELLDLPLARFRRVHEIFAQTTEKYFFEGKFESSGIRFLMDTFRKWMLPYAKTIGMTYLRYPPLPITPEIERMFEAIIGGSNKADEIVVPMFQASLFGEEVLGKETKYQEILDEVRSQAMGGTYTELFNMGIKEREKQIYKHSVEYTKRATENVDQAPAMQMLKYFTNIYAEYKAGEVPESRISIESVSEYLFADDMAAAQDFKKTLPSVVISGLKKGGIDIRQFMAMNDINSKEQMIQLLEGTAKREEWIDAEFDQIVREELPIYKTDDEIHAIAVEKMNMDGKGELLAEEMRILATQFLPTLKGVTSKLINPASYISKDAKPILMERAVNQIAETKMSQYSRPKLLRDSERQGREAANQFKNNDFQKAFDAKYRQAQNFFAYQAGKEVDKLIAHTNLMVKRVTNFAANTQNAAKYDIAIINYGKKVIFAIENGMQIPAFSKQDISVHSPISTLQVEEINKLASTFAAEIGTDTKDLTVSNYVAKGRLIGAIVKVAKAVRHLEIDGKTRNVMEMSKETAVGLNEGSNVVNYQTDKKGTIASWSRVQKMNTTSLIKGMYASDEAYLRSPLAALERNVREAEAQVNITLANSEKAISEALKKTFRKEDKFSKALFEPVTGRAYRLVGKSTDRPIIAGTLKYTFNSKSELNAAMLMALGSQSGMNKFMQGNLKAATDLEGNVNPQAMWDQVQEFINDGTLNKADFEFYQVVWDSFEKVHPLVKDAMRKVDGYEVGKIEATPFSVAVEGETLKLSGGYYPAARERSDMSTLEKADQVKSKETNNINAHDMYPSRQIGLTKERSDQMYPVNLDLRNVTRYLSTALNIAHLRVPMDAFEKVIHSPEVEEVFERRRPGAIENVIVLSFERTKNQVYTEFSRDGKDNMARFLRNNVNQVLYLANVKSALKQFLGLGQAATYVGATRLAKTAIFIAANPKASRANISEVSIVMRERYQNSVAAFARTITDLDTNNFDWISWTDEKTQKGTFLLSQMTQNIVDTIVWQAAYNKAREENDMDPTLAVAYADDAVITSQSSASVSSLTNIQSGRDSAKLFTQVLSVPISISNNLSIEMQRDQKLSNKAIFIAKLGLFSIMLPIALELNLTPESDEEEEKNRRKSEDEQMDDKIFMLNSRAATSGIELVMPMLTRPISGNLGPVFGTMGQGPRSVNAVGKKIGGVDLSDRDVQVLLDQATLYSGKGIFALASQGLTYYDSLVKSKQEKRHEKLVRRHQLLRKKYADRR